jgi:tetratricopeptide (TPR) repeat protein
LRNSVELLHVKCASCVCLRIGTGTGNLCNEYFARWLIDIHRLVDAEHGNAGALYGEDMPQLNAFVGHSFAKEDEAVVRELLTLVESIKNVMPAFTWDSAEAAEPKVLSAKVREKMKGKNLFIGICTAREQTVQTAQPPALFARWFLPKTQLAVERISVETKTADWIIQEIAYALGSNMDLILLLESDVRPPGGLQGDMEYIPFTRSEPSKCLGKLSNMLSSLSPKPTSGVESPEKPAAGESADVPGNDLFTQTYLAPDPSWKADTYISRFRFSILVDDPGSQQRISVAFRSSPFSQDEEARVGFEATRISQRAQVYKEDWLNPLRKLVTEHPTRAGPYLALAERYAAAGENEWAANNYELAAQHSVPPHKKIRFLIDAAARRTDANQPEAAENLLRSAAELVRANPEHEADGLGRMSYVWKELGKTDLFLACAERCLELAPDRIDPRFALAHKYADLDRDAEALFHYRQYLREKDDPGGWNNLAVAASALKLPVTAIDGYLRADKEGNTLATSNLAYTKLGAGFADEAIELCNQGLKAKEPNPRLYEALAKCKRAQEDEATKESELLGATKDRREVLRATGKASLLATPDSLRSTWQGPRCQLSATLDGSRVRMVGTYERKLGNTLGNLMRGLFTDDRTETVTAEFIGELYGEAFVGKVKTSAPSMLAGLLSLADKGNDCVGYLDSNGTQLVILEGKIRYVLDAYAGN